MCKAEYRRGFTHCTDCDVDLVWELPKTAIEVHRAAPPGDPNEDPFCSFWKGQDARVHAELCTVLDEAGIPHNTVFRRDHLFNMRNYPAFEVGVPFSMFEQAENAVKEAYGADDTDESGDSTGTDGGMGSLEQERQVLKRLPETLTPSPAEDIPGPPNAGEGTDWFPEDATENVWSGAAEDRGDFLVAALHENGIRCRLDKNARRDELFVLPDDEARAREIIREIVEGQAPE